MPKLSEKNKKLKKFSEECNNILNNIRDVSYPNFFDYCLDVLPVYLNVLKRCEDVYEYKKCTEVQVIVYSICKKFIDLIIRFMDNFSYYYKIKETFEEEEIIELDDNIDNIIKISNEILFIILEKDNIHMLDEKYNMKLKTIKKVLYEIDKDTLNYLKKYRGKIIDVDYIFLIHTKND